jgi:hypothetical protein
MAPSLIRPYGGGQAILEQVFSLCLPALPKALAKVTGRRPKLALKGARKGFVCLKAGVQGNV